MTFKIFTPFLALFVSACGGHAGAYVIEPAPLWLPSPTPALLPTAVPLPASGTAAVATPTPAPKRPKGATDTHTPTATETPSPTVTPTRATGFYLVPLQDKRKDPAIHKGRSLYQTVLMEPSGAAQLAKVWRKRPYGDMAYLVHRQLAYSLASTGYTVSSAELPPADLGAALAEARAAGAQFLIGGKITRLDIVQRGADAFLGTNFGGTNYYLNMELELQLVDVASGRPGLLQKVDLQRVFYDPKMLGSEDRDTFPRYFATGLPELMVKAVGLAPLREAAGLPTFTSTPSITPTPEIFMPKAGEPTPQPTATPDSGPYWVNPKTGERVDPSWNFDPKDGTPREKFILRQPLPAEPKRPTEPR